MIYAIQAGDGPIKIGKSRKVSSRLKELQVSSHLDLKLLAECNWHDQNEVILHEYLKDSYIRGEWFDPTEKVMLVVEFLKKDDFYGLMAKISKDRGGIPRTCLPRFDKKVYQRMYMAVKRAVMGGRADWWPRRV